MTNKYFIHTTQSISLFQRSYSQTTMISSKKVKIYPLILSLDYLWYGIVQLLRIKSIFFFLCTATLYTQTLQPQRIDDFPFLQRDAVTKRIVDTLTLDELYAVINANHPKLTTAQLGIDRANATVMRSWGTLDPQLESSYDFKQEDGKYKQQTLNAGVTIPTYWGPKIVAGFRRELGFFNQDILTAESGQASIGVQIPLWRNILIDKNRATILKSEALQPAAKADFIETRNELFLKSSEKYWDWSGAFAKFKISTQLLSYAQFRYDGIIQEVKLGERSPIDSIEAFQEIQRRQGSYIKSRRDYEKAHIALSVFIWLQNGEPSTIPFEVGPMTMPTPIILRNSEYSEDKAKAVLLRPEVQQLDAQINAADVDIRFANEQWKPDLAVKFAPYNTLGQTSQSSVFDYKMGIDLSMPIIQRDARGQQDLALIKQKEYLLKKILQIRDVQADVDDAASEVIAAIEQHSAATLERESAQRMEEAERALFTRGESNLFTVNIRERASAEAQQREVDALATYHKAAARYRWSTAKF